MALQGCSPIAVFIHARVSKREREGILHNTCVVLSFIDYAQTTKCITARAGGMEDWKRVIVKSPFVFLLSGLFQLVVVDFFFLLRKKKAPSLILCGNEKALELEAQYKHSHLNGQRCGTGYLFLSLFLSFPFLLSEDTLSLFSLRFRTLCRKKKSFLASVQIRCMYILSRGNQQSCDIG